MTAGLFNLPGWPDSNSGMGKENNPVTGRHFALDLSLEQSMHGGHGPRA
jgi:hypothetical protein